MTQGFHEGELAVQREAGVAASARRLEAMLGPADLSGGAHRFLAAQRYAVLTARDGGGRLWSAPLTGPAGFLDGRGDTLTVATLPRPGDPLRGLPDGQQVGLIAIDFNARRRIRINGVLAAVSAGGLVIQVDQAYGNCPQHIHAHDVDGTTAVGAADAPFSRAAQLTPAAQALIVGSDTFFLGTTHPDRGSDASHRGGPPGFVRVESPTRLWWPDYAGNNMFNSFGNLAVDDEAALLFTDYATGSTVQLSGSARLVWTERGAVGDDGGVGRRVEFTAAVVVTGPTG